MADGRRAARKARYRPSEERAGVIAAARIAWLLTGGVWATHALVGFAEPEYWNPVTTLDFAAVWLYSAGFRPLRSQRPCSGVSFQPARCDGRRS